MKLKIFWAVLFTAIAFAAGWNYSQSQNEIELSDLTLANTEALAQGELLPGDNRYIVRVGTGGSISGGDVHVEINCDPGGSSICPK